MKTKAAVLYKATQALQIEEVELLPPQTGEILVRWVATGVCRSDLNHIQGLAPWPTPVVLGHEGAGIVEEVGPDVTRVRVGDHVLSSFVPHCGCCSWCIAGRPNLCDLRYGKRELMLDGTTRFRKGDIPIHHYLYVSTFAERSVVPEFSVVSIRRDAPLDVVCLISCGVATGAGAVIKRAEVQAGSCVAVFGCGGVGLNAIQASALVGAAKIIAVDTIDRKLNWAHELGATYLVNATKEDPVSRIHKICDRDGADYAIEAAGRSETIEQAFYSVHRGGIVVIAGVSPEGTRLSIDPKMLLHERILTGTSFGSVRQGIDLPMFVDLFMQGKYKLRELISHKFALDQLNEAFELLQRGEVCRSIILYP